MRLNKKMNNILSGVIKVKNSHLFYELETSVWNKNTLKIFDKKGVLKYTRNIIFPLNISEIHTANHLLICYSKADRMIYLIDFIDQRKEIM